MSSQFLYFVTILSVIFLVFGLLYLAKKIFLLKNGMNNLGSSVRNLDKNVTSLIEVIESRDYIETEIEDIDDISRCENCINKVTMVGPSGDRNIIFKCKISGKKVSPDDTCISFKLDRLNL